MADPKIWADPALAERLFEALPDPTGAEPGPLARNATLLSFLVGALIQEGGRLGAAEVLEATARQLRDADVERREDTIIDEIWAGRDRDKPLGPGWTGIT